MREHKSENRERGGAPPLWHVPVAVEDVPETGQHFDLVADADVRGGVARAAGLRDLPRLAASFDVARRGAHGLHVVGEVSATVGQTCVVTLEPLVNEIAEKVDLLFMPPPVSAPQAEEGSEASDTARAITDEPEPLLDGRVDLGALATEFLLLGLDPYPRKPGAAFQPPPDAAADGGGPFAALGSLKKGRDGR
jgi:Large ribosomal RNA subunit accumulation protein YceD